MDLDYLRQRLQNHFSDGLVTIVGSGLSVAEGIPGMGGLASHLLAEIPKHLDESSDDLWNRISDDLRNDMDLESALLRTQPNDQIESLIVDFTSGFILAAETRVIEKVASGEQTLRFSRLIPHMLKPPTGIPIVTTNYDRLLEIALENSKLCVNTLFVGHHFGRLDPEAAHMTMCKQLEKHKGKHALKLYDHAIVLKPHGSLDWFMHNGEPVRCPLAIGRPRLIITPGLNKYRGGYNRPFDSHRERANREIDKAVRFLIIGYGFRDEHLQTHLEPALKRGKPAVVITHSLTPQAEALINECHAMIGLCAAPSGIGTRVVWQGQSEIFAGIELWDLNGFVKGLFEL